MPLSGLSAPPATEREAHTKRQLRRSACRSLFKFCLNLLSNLHTGTPLLTIERYFRDRATQNLGRRQVHLRLYAPSPSAKGICVYTCITTTLPGGKLSLVIYLPRVGSAP